ncbi:MAG: Rdx family protein [Clostridia bacterium]|nr:Rdx family protein [Clostridia bacterium]
MSLAQKVLSEHKNNIEDLSIVPSTGGAFEIRVNGNLIFSKLMENRFPGLGEAESLIRNEVF